jgi:hypothetical protein
MSELTEAKILALATTNETGAVKPDGKTIVVSGDGTLSALGVPPIYEVLKETSEIDRFDPIYWTIDGPLSMSFCITNYPNGIESRFVARAKNDLCGITWKSENTLDHELIGYSTNRDYRGLVWTFDIELAPTCPVLNQEELAPVITVEATVNGQPIVYYIALKNYAGPDTDKPVRKATITIDWSNVQGGFFPEIPVDASNINAIFFSGVVSGYIENDPSPLPEPVEGYIRLTNFRLSGTGTKLSYKRAFLPPHEFGMSTGYDDQYNLNPERVVRNCQLLGYRGWINHYCGMSHYPNTFWNANAKRYVNAPAGDVPGVNAAARQWHLEFAKACKRAKYLLIFSVSYEYFSLFALNGESGLPDWIQRDWDGNPSVTGYIPPSHFFSLCNKDAMDYLHQIFVEFAEILAEAELPIYMQVGEPWWWYNPKTSLPCVYDYPTKLAFNAATGLYMQDMGTITEAKSLTQTPFPEMYAFLRKTLGESVQDCRAAIKKVYPDAKVCPLIFLPTILDESSGIMNFINYPVEQYKYPNFEFIMTECYDWITSNQLIKSYLAIENAIQDFEYPPELIQYLGGFVDMLFNDIALRKKTWQRIIGNLKNNKRYNIQKQHIWAYPQVMRDSITIVDANDLICYYFGDELMVPIRQDERLLESEEQLKI